jgi:hypothetical protein
MCWGSRGEKKEADEEGDPERRTFAHTAASLRGDRPYSRPPVQVKAAFAD